MRAVAVLCVLILPDALRAQLAPQISTFGVVSAADNSSAELGLARGSIFTIYGTGLAQRAEHADPNSPTSTLAGTRVKFRASQTVRYARLLYVSPGQINAIAPADIEEGPAGISVETAIAESGSVWLKVVAARFTAFTHAGCPFGPAIVQQYVAAGITLNRLLNPAVAGDALVLWGTGLGVEPGDDVLVYMGLVAVRPFYAGPAPNLPGVDQVNLIVPPGLTSRCFLPFLVRAGGRNSPVYTLSTNTSRGPCPTETAIGQSGLEKLDRGATVQVTVLTIQSDSDGGTQRESAEAWVGEYDAAHLGILATFDWGDWGDAGAVACTRRGYGYDRFHIPAKSLGMPPEFYGIRRKDSPLAIAITGPSNCAWGFLRGEDGVYREAGPAGCPMLNYAIRASDGISSASGKIPQPNPSPPVPQVEFKRASDGAAVTWSNPGGARLTIELSSTFVLPGNIFSGYTEVRELSCRLGGYSGAARLSPLDVDWALGLPSAQSASYRLSLTGLQGGSWSGPDSALLIRTTQILQAPLSIR